MKYCYAKKMKLNCFFRRLPDFDNDDVDDTLVIALSVTGGVILILAIAAGAFFYNKKKKSRR
jgi:hypothetical protein